MSSRRSGCCATSSATASAHGRPASIWRFQVWLVTSARNASWSARSWLGLPCIEEGAPADVVVYDADPRADLDTLARPRHVVLRGEVVR